MRSLKHLGRNCCLHGQHLETLHAEGTSAFVAADAADEINLPHNYGECPVDGCGEMILASEMTDHLELHAEQDCVTVAGNADEDEGGTAAKRSSESHKEASTSTSSNRVVGEKQKSAVRKWKQLLLMPSRKGSSSKDRNNTSAGLQKGRRKLGVRFIHAISTDLP